MDRALLSRFDDRISFSKRCADLVMRASVLALGLALGGVSPVLGAAAPEGSVGKTVLPASAPANDVLRSNGDGSADMTADMTPGRREDRVESAFDEAFSDPPLWGEWRFVANGRDQVFGLGLLYPGAKPDIMRERARSLELRFYMPY